VFWLVELLLGYVLSASWAIDSEPIRARGIIVKSMNSKHRAGAVGRRGCGSLNPNPHSWIFTSVSVGSFPLPYLFTSATVRIPAQLIRMLCKIALPLKCRSPIVLAFNWKLLTQPSTSLCHFSKVYKLKILYNFWVAGHDNRPKKFLLHISQSHRRRHYSFLYYLKTARQAVWQTSPNQCHKLSLKSPEGIRW